MASIPPSGSEHVALFQRDTRTEHGRFTVEAVRGLFQTGRRRSRADVRPTVQFHHLGRVSA